MNKKNIDIKQSKILNKSPYFSIITVVKNSETTIEKTIKSVIKQRFKNFEYIVIDGQSNDGTLNKIKKYQKYINLFSSKPDKNLWDAMNRGIKMSRGEIIAFLNAGDVYYSSALNMVSNYFSKHKLDFLFASVKKERVYHGYYPKKIFYKFNIYPAHSCGFFIKKKSQIQIGYYDTKLKYGADLDLFYKISSNTNLIGMSTKKNEITGKFDLNGISSKIPFYKRYYYESLVRYKNNQNIVFIIILYILNIVNKLRNIIIK